MSGPSSALSAVLPHRIVFASVRLLASPYVVHSAAEGRRRVAGESAVHHRKVGVIVLTSRRHRPALLPEKVQFTAVGLDSIVAHPAAAAI